MLGVSGVGLREDKREPEIVTKDDDQRLHQEKALDVRLLKPCRLQPVRLLWSMGFSRQEYWSGLPVPSPRDLPNQGLGPESPALQADSTD